MQPIFVCLTNIPTPYRSFQFARMHEHLRQRGWNFEVWFMARSEPGRQWTFADSDLQFPHRFLQERRFRIGSDCLHCNPEVLARLRKTRPDVLLVAGSWTSPTVWLAMMTSTRERIIFWCESHRQSIRRNRFPVRLARKFVLSRFAEFAVPGALAAEYATEHAHPKQVHFLPNLVDPELFHNGVKTRRGTRFLRRGKRTLLIAARLIPEKGLDLFFQSLAGLTKLERHRLKVVIAGDGPLRSDFQRWIDRHDLDVRLAGHQGQTEMTDLYAQADGFCLPSISDPNPVAVIEALWAGLPLLLSSRVGNHPECLEEGHNGFLFDPLDGQAATYAIARWLALSNEELEALGRASETLAQTRFVPDRVIARFLNDVLELRTANSLGRPRSISNRDDLEMKSSHACVASAAESPK